MGFDLGDWIFNIFQWFCARIEWSKYWTDNGGSVSVESGSSIRGVSGSVLIRSSPSFSYFGSGNLISGLSSGHKSGSLLLATGYSEEVSWKY